MIVKLQSSIFAKVSFRLYSTAVLHTVHTVHRQARVLTTLDGGVDAARGDDQAVLTWGRGPVNEIR